MRGVSKYVLFILWAPLLLPGCAEEPPPPKAGPPLYIGAWKVTGDTMAAWKGNSASPLYIKLVYVSPEDYNSDLPGVRFVLMDSSITTEEYNDFNIFESEFRLNVPASFDLISSNFKSKGSNSKPASFNFHIVYEVYCEHNSSVDQLALLFYNGKNSEQKYEFNAEGMGEAIKHIACK